MFDDLHKFLREFKISEDDFSETHLRWDELQAIRKDYCGIIKELNLIARYIEDKLQELDVVHSVRCRIKDPDHLIAKIIRKRITSPGRKITIDNYRSLITDLIGIRAIHLFKEDWVYIHRFIEDTWDLYETPTAYIRQGDNGPYLEEYKRYEFNIEPHLFGYRSIHYLVASKPSKDLNIAEIQVRTIFEEGWSEIDHIIKYPKNVADPLLDTFLDNFNILAGNSDQMGSFVRHLKEDLLKGSQKLEMYEKLTEKHAGIIDTLKKRVAGTLGELDSKIKSADKKVGLLIANNVDATPFERVLNGIRHTVVGFERELAHEPQKATELYDFSVRELERLDALLEIELENTEHANKHYSGNITIFSYGECAVRFSNNVRTLKELEAELNVVTSALLPTEEDSHIKVKSAVDVIRARSGFVRTLVGPKYADIQVLRKEVEVNKEKLRALSKLAERIVDPATRSVLLSQIDLFTEQNGHLRSFVDAEERRTSLFGWFLKRLRG
ncbi:MAG: RelA/SpoT domain-containing protein [Candidatus Pacebacteria bacterium]|nr:RelA/SpoT domain-containing protein [Candidatus Paceibacterota bacterium]